MKKWKKIAKSNGILESTFKSRVYKQGWDPEKAATKPPQIKKPRTDHKWIKLAEKNGIHKSTYIYRVDELFWPPEEAATTQPLSHGEIVKRAVQIRKEHREIEEQRLFKDPNNQFRCTKYHLEIAEKNGIKESTVRTRLWKGWTIQDAISVPIPKKPEYTKTPGYYEFLEVAKENGIKPDTYRNRIGLHGWDPERAATTPPLDRSEQPKRARKDREWIRLAEKNGIQYQTYWDRIKRGWTCEEAATTPTLRKGQTLNEERKQRMLEGMKKMRGIRTN